MLAHSGYPSPTITRFFEQHGQLITIKKNQTICSKNINAEFIYLIKKGVSCSQYHIHDKSVYLTLSPSNTIIGLSSLFDTYQYHLMSEIAHTDVTLLQIERHFLESELIYDNILQFEWLAFSQYYYKKIQQRLLDLLMLNKKYALYTTLIRLYHSLSTPYQNNDYQRQLTIDLTMQDLAYLSCTTREMISKLMNELKQQHIVIWKRKKFIFLDIDYIKNQLNMDELPASLYQIF